VCLESRVNHGSFCLWMRIWVTVKTLLSLVKTCHTLVLSDEYRTQYKVLVYSVLLLYVAYSSKSVGDC